MSDPQEAATPSDPHSAAAEAEYPYNSLYPDAITNAMRHSFVAGRVSRDAEVAELRAEKDRWHDAALIGLAQESALEREVAELKAKIADAWDEGAQALMPILAFGMKVDTSNPYRTASVPASSPVEGG